MGSSDKTTGDMQLALRVLSEAIENTKRKATILGPARTKQVVENLVNAYNQLKDAADNVLSENEELKQELERQRQRIKELETIIEELESQLVSMREEQSQASANLQNQIDDVTKVLADREDAMKFLFDTIRMAVESAQNVFTYGRKYPPQ